MNANKSRTKGRSASVRINAAKAAKKIPTAILLERKAKCDAAALKIVERLIEPMIEESWLLQNLGQINRSHLQDVIEERAILKYCGYVLCDNPLTRVIKKKYEISTRNNKVYDVQCTKDFCSFWCYSASEYLLEQMLESPLWLRNEEQQIPEFKIFDQPKEKVKNAPGVEINIVGIDLPADLDGSEEQEGKRGKEEKKRENFEDVKLVFNECNEVVEAERDESRAEIIDANGRDPDEEKMDISVHSETEAPEKSGKPEKFVPSERKRGTLRSNFTENTEKRKKLKAKSVPFDVVIAQVERSFTEWITGDTITLLHGDDLMKQKILENVTMQERYGELCKKLNSIQLEEGKEDRVAAIQSNVLKPAPHFSILQEEAQALELKVRAFYQGTPVIEAPVVKKETKGGENEEGNSVVPLTEAHAPIALRRRIFLDKLNKILPDLLRTLSGPGQFQYIYTPERVAKVKALVHTFKLSATNIVFKTAQWTLVALLIIKILSVIDNNIKHLLSSKQANMYIAMILMSYHLDSNYLDRLITSLTIVKEKEIDMEN